MSSLWRPILRERSRPVRARGLKPFPPSDAELKNGVAPRAGAWIETPAGSQQHDHSWSRPVRARGLKLERNDNREEYSIVAPRAGAWIETRCAGPPDPSDRVAPRAGAWIETSMERRLSEWHSGRAPCGRVD